MDEQTWYERKPTNEGHVIKVTYAKVGERDITGQGDNDYLYIVSVYKKVRSEVLYET